LPNLLKQKADRKISSIAAFMPSSKSGKTQPPCTNAPDVSSLGAPGARITPSSERKAVKVSFDTIAPPK
jgi:hypothetical protein